MRYTTRYLGFLALLAAIKHAAIIVPIAAK